MAGVSSIGQKQLQSKMQKQTKPTEDFELETEHRTEVASQPAGPESRKDKIELSPAAIEILKKSREHQG